MLGNTRPKKTTIVRSTIYSTSRTKKRVPILMETTIFRRTEPYIMWKNAKSSLKRLFNAQQMNPIERKLFGRIVESTAKEKSQLLNWYQGKCQMCDSVIRGYDGKPHFIAKNIVNTSDLSDEVRKTVELAWNSLCLCPNCAKKYEVCSRDLNGLYTQIVETPIVEGSNAKITLEIMLDEKKQNIRFVPKHFFVMKKNDSVD